MVENNLRKIDGVAELVGHSLAFSRQDFGSKPVSTTSSFPLTTEQFIETKSI